MTNFEVKKKKKKTILSALIIIEEDDEFKKLKFNTRFFELISGKSKNKPKYIEPLLQFPCLVGYRTGLDPKRNLEGVLLIFKKGTPDKKKSIVGKQYFLNVKGNNQNSKYFDAINKIQQGGRKW